MTATKESIQAVAEELGITMTVVFVPWSKSRNKGEKTPSLNWKVTLHKSAPTLASMSDRKPILTTDYIAGCGHCPSYQQRATVDRQSAVAFECEHGRTCANIQIGMRGAPILPELADVLHSLVSEAEALDYGTFEEWAESMGYDTDSRRAESIYRACLKTALRLRNGLGDDGLRRLRDAVQDY